VIPHQTASLPAKTSLLPSALERRALAPSHLVRTELALCSGFIVA
jgi:hypothetical protein